MLVVIVGGDDRGKAEAWTLLLPRGVWASGRHPVLLPGRVEPYALGKRHSLTRRDSVGA
jgi:hypothetical protein